MNTAEIVAALPKLAAEDRAQVFERLCELQEADVLRGAGPTDDERRILDAALAEFEADGDPGAPWRDALARIRRTTAS